MTSSAFTTAARRSGKASGGLWWHMPVLPACVIHRGCRLTKVILDRGVELPRNLIIGENPEADARRFFRTSGGVTLVTREMLKKLKETEPELFKDFDNYSSNRSPVYLG